jgi:hypothetical protein
MKRSALLAALLATAGVLAATAAPVDPLTVRPTARLAHAHAHAHTRTSLRVT